MYILQICNVGNIVGGTAACAWTVTRALPWARHTVAFLGDFNSQTQATFAPVELLRWKHVEPRDVKRLRPDLVLLHNTPRSRCEQQLPVATLQYLHSKISPAQADVTVYCSQWLASQYGHPDGPVLYQAVPFPPVQKQRTLPGTTPRPIPRHPRDHLLVGRLCTPQRRKWPSELADFYGTLARRVPEIDWEFVGCPADQQPAFQRACAGRARFHEASWSARAHLGRWDALLYHHPTLTESFGRTCAEALRAGCIPIVDNRGGFREQLLHRNPATRSPDCLNPVCAHTAQHHPTGFLCDDGTSFATALETLSDPSTRRRYALAAYRHGNASFSLERFSRDLLAAFRRISSNGLRTA